MYECVCVFYTFENLLEGQRILALRDSQSLKKSPQRGALGGAIGGGKSDACEMKEGECA